MGKAPISEEVREIRRAGKGREMVALARKGGGTLEANGTTYRIRPARDSESECDYSAEQARLFG